MNQPTFVKIIYKAIPSDVSDEAWEAMTGVQQNEVANWLPARINIADIQAYRGTTSFYTIIELRNGDKYTAKIRLDVFDKLLGDNVNILKA